MFPSLGLGHPPDPSAPARAPCPGAGSRAARPPTPTQIFLRAPQHETSAKCSCFVLFQISGLKGVSKSGRFLRRSERTQARGGMLHSRGPARRFVGRVCGPPAEKPSGADTSAAPTASRAGDGRPQAHQPGKGGAPSAPRRGLVAFGLQA